MVKKVAGVVLLLLLMVGCSSGGMEQQENEFTGENASELVAEDVREKVETIVQVSLAEVFKTFDDAYPDANIIGVELLSRGDNVYYVIDGFDKANEHTMRVDATTGAVMRRNSEAIESADLVDLSLRVINIRDLKPVVEVVDIVLAEEGVTAVSKLELQQDRGVTYWEARVRQNRLPRTIEINAHTGAVIS